LTPNRKMKASTATRAAPAGVNQHPHLRLRAVIDEADRVADGVRSLLCGRNLLSISQVLRARGRVFGFSELAGTKSGQRITLPSRQFRKTEHPIPFFRRWRCEYRFATKLRHVRDST